MTYSAGFRNSSKFSSGLIVTTGFCGFVVSLASSFLVGSFVPVVVFFGVLILLAHPTYILALIIILNPLSDWLVVTFPSILTKEIIDILIMIFILGTIAIKLVKRKPWAGAPFTKWILILITLFVISAILNWTGLEDVLVMNWVHFRFIYMAIAITQLSLGYERYHKLIEVFFVVCLFHMGLGLFQAVGGEWAKNFFYRELSQISLSYRALQYTSYDTALHFNLGGFTYIYSTFFSPVHYGGFLLIMLCLFFGMRMAGTTGQRLRNYISVSSDKNLLNWIVLRKEGYISLLILSTLLIVLTFNRSTYLGFFVLISFLVLNTANSYQKLGIYGATLLLLVVLVVNAGSLIAYVKGVGNPAIGIFDPLSRFLSVFSSYVLQETPRKIAYFDILPKIFTEKPLFGLGVTSVLSQERFFSDSFALSNSLPYVYGDAGIVRFFVEYGVLGSLVYGILFVSIFKHARNGYLFSKAYEERTVCFAAMSALITVIPVSIGTSLLFSKSFGLYLWMLIGLSQRWGNGWSTQSYDL